MKGECYTHDIQWGSAEVECPLCEAENKIATLEAVAEAAREESLEHLMGCDCKLCLALDALKQA